MCVGKEDRGDIDPSRWAVDQRPFVWAAPSKPVDDNAPGSPPWTGTSTGGSDPVTPLPYALSASGLAKTGGEAESSKTLECSTSVPREGIVLQSKVWEPELNGGEATAPMTRSFLRSIPSFPASSVEGLRSNPRIILPALQKSADGPYPVDFFMSARCKQEGLERSSSWGDDQIEEDPGQNAAALKRQLSSSSTYSAKSSRLIHHRANHSSRPGASKKGERATPFKDASVSESLSDTVDEDGVEIVSEKRRKRMLSNRASAQRSRQRRQERLDTLEVLVAELRVENTSLVRKAKNATVAAKKFEEENDVLRKWVGKQGALPLSDGNNCDARDEVEITEGRPTRLSSPSHAHEIRHERYPPEIHGLLKSDLVNEPFEDSKQPHQSWNISSGSFEMELTFDPMKQAADMDSTKDQNMEHSAGINLTDVRQSKTTSVVQQSSFQGLEDPFGIDLEQCSQEMDRNLDSRGVEDIWVNGCWAPA